MTMKTHKKTSKILSGQVRDRSKQVSQVCVVGITDNHIPCLHILSAAPRTAASRLMWCWDRL